jgi:hypothetical protein
VTEKFKCACPSEDAHSCWSLRYHGHSAMSELTVHNEGGPCECACHDQAEDGENETHD